VDVLTAINIFGTIVVLVFSVYNLNNKYDERALRMRKCYIKLSSLENSINKDNYARKCEDYQKILNNFENHHMLDYLEVLYNENIKFSLRELCLYGYFKVIEMIKYFMLLMPFIVTIIIVIIL
ncbi:MAG: SLATT domain-containing protein, partial [Fusobacteriales bacterium]|nr:SLATT domain-containing protein [Fusobacteriales bacterium]